MSWAGCKCHKWEKVIYTGNTYFSVLGATKGNMERESDELPVGFLYLESSSDLLE